MSAPSPHMLPIVLSQFLSAINTSVAMRDIIMGGMLILLLIAYNRKPSVRQYDRLYRPGMYMRQLTLATGQWGDLPRDSQNRGMWVWTV